MFGLIEGQPKEALRCLKRDSRAHNGRILTVSDFQARAEQKPTVPGMIFLRLGFMEQP